MGKSTLMLQLAAGLAHLGGEEKKTEPGLSEGEASVGDPEDGLEGGWVGAPGCEWSKGRTGYVPAGQRSPAEGARRAPFSARPRRPRRRGHLGLRLQVRRRQRHEAPRPLPTGEHRRHRLCRRCRCRRCRCRCPQVEHTHVCQGRGGRGAGGGPAPRRDASEHQQAATAATAASATRAAPGVGCLAAGQDAAAAGCEGGG